MNNDVMWWEKQFWEEPFSPPASSSPTTREHHTCHQAISRGLSSPPHGTEDSKYHTDSASYNPGNPSGSGTELTSPEIVYLTSQNHIPDQINCSSDWSHIQQTFHLSSNPLRMYNSSSSSASSSTDSWDFDPDLIIPDVRQQERHRGLISLIINPIYPYQFQREHDLHQLGCFESEDEDEEQGEETGRGGILRLKIIKPQQLPHQKLKRTPIDNTNLSLLISSSSDQEINNSLDSISSHLPSERQSTIKASITPTPTLTSTASSSTHESSPSQPPPNQLSNLPFPSASSSSSSVLNPAPSTGWSGLARGWAWCYNHEETDHWACPIYRSHQTQARLSKRNHRQKKMRPGVCDLFDSTYIIKRHDSVGSIDQLTVNPKSQRMTSKCGTVTEYNLRGVDDPVCDLLQEPLALSGQLTEKGKPIKEPSGFSLTGLDLDFLEDDEPAELKKCSSILSSSFSTSFSIFGNNNINNDSTPRIRTRPSLLSDCSSSPFNEAEDDINKGFFDDIEFPPKFGIPKNLHPASTPSNPSSSLPSSKIHKPTESVHLSSSESSRIVESKKICKFANLSKHESLRSSNNG
ncbi:hypothetical protein BY996DRAFT_6541984 [Phakopsora pachyrhizi]|nr:hypothetical protein BY996DRAFT_6541984 [Phakopsora pachyrhizi]